MLNSDFVSLSLVFGWKPQLKIFKYLVMESISQYLQVHLKIFHFEFVLLKVCCYYFFECIYGPCHSCAPWWGLNMGPRLGMGRWGIERSGWVLPLCKIPGQSIFFINGDYILLQKAIQHKRTILVTKSPQQKT